MRRNFWLGCAAGLSCAVIWGVQAVVTRQGIKDGLTVADITVLRFLVAGILLLPVALRMRPPLAGRIGWKRMLLFACLVGTPYSLLIVGGLITAPAVHQAVIGPACIPLFAAVLARAIVGERIGRQKWIGLTLVIAGIVVFFHEAITRTSLPAGTWKGDLLFVAAAAMWSVFGLLTQRWGANALETSAATCVISLLTVPLWAFAMPMNMAHVPASAIVLQAVYQGAVVGAGALFLYARAVELLGSASAAIFLPLMPVVTALAAWQWLGEATTPNEVVGMAIVATGMMIAVRASAR